MKVYDAMAEAFVAEGTTAVFTMMGDANMQWLNAMSRLGAGIYDVRHEGAGLAMADGWARVAGTPGVCSTTSGPGTAQLATTLVVASRARTPLVAFCGDTARGDTRDAQRFDQQRFAAACECGYVRVDTPTAAHEAVRKAFYLARTASRPIMLSVASDLQEEEAAAAAAEPYVPSSALFTGGRPHPDPALLAAAADAIAASARPVLLLGRGAVASDAGDAALAVADRIGALVFTTLHAKGWLADRTPYHAGIAGGYGTRTARRLLREADCVVAVGTTANPWTTDGGELLRDAVVVHVDVAPDAILGHGVAADHVLQADARVGLEELDRELEARGAHGPGLHSEEVLEELSVAWVDDDAVELEEGTVDPREACLLLDELVPEDVALVLGSGQQVRFPTMLMRRPRRFILAQHHFGCIGQGLTVAIGAVIASGGRLAFVIEGDAGLMMHLGDFDTAVRYELPLLTLVMNDEAVGAELHKSIAISLDPELTTIRSPDLGAVGVALGGRGALVRSIDELRAAVEAFLADPAPTLVDIRISRTVLSIPYRRTFRGEDV